VIALLPCAGRFDCTSALSCSLRNNFLDDEAKQAVQQLWEASRGSLEDRIRTFYERHAPAELPRIKPDSIAKKYANAEAALFRTLERKYAVTGTEGADVELAL